LDLAGDSFEKRARELFSPTRFRRRKAPCFCDPSAVVAANGNRTNTTDARFFACPVISTRLLLHFMSDVTCILSAIEQGDPHAAKELLPVVYDELRKLAAQKLAYEKPGQTLQATALVHEAYLRLVGDARDQHWNSRGHFFAAAAEAMRRILIDSVRRKRRPKHGGDHHRIDMDELGDALALEERREDLLALDEALGQFAQKEPAKAELVRLRYFAGLSLEEAAACLGISPATAKRYWAISRAWLFAALGEGTAPKSE
jgi:RNA polymerase sigma factor (TIGR02999 family)